MSKSIMIVGAGPGIGQAVAERFGREGWTIVLAGRNAQRLASLTTELTSRGIKASGVAVDATDPVALRAAIKKAADSTGGLSAIHFNAAVVRQQDFFSMSDTEVVSDLAVNVAGGLHTIRAAVEHFGTSGGVILVTGGGLAITPHASYAGLGAGKAALRNIVQGLHESLARSGVRIAIATVNTLVSPGSVEAKGAADTLWKLASDARAPWEVTYQIVKPQRGN